MVKECPEGSNRNEMQWPYEIFVMMILLSMTWRNFWSLLFWVSGVGYTLSPANHSDIKLSWMLASSFRSKIVDSVACYAALRCSMSSIKMQLVGFFMRELTGVWELGIKR